MLVSLKWLGDYVDISDLAPEAVCTALTDIGLEVESVTRESVVPAEVIVGRVVAAAPHPNADSLRVCKVDVGQGEPLDIVCGAPNAREGIKVAVAMIGATLPGDFKIKKSKIRGETSNGMLCSEKELTLSESHQGIIELGEGAKIGEPVARALGLDDVVIEVKVTPNRPDCLGLVGIARDVAARLRRTFKEPLPEPPRTNGVKTEGQVKVVISDEDGCSRFIALYVKDVATVPSPAWMQKRLTAAGMRPINLIVDATNYVMLEFSQPIHAYDERSIRGRVIEVRAAKPDETLKTLDGQARKLEAGDIVIADAEGAIGLAGIMGGESSEVRPDTQNIVIEVACFSPRRVRKTARRLGLHTEASHRFERGVDVDGLARVAWRVAELIAKNTDPAATGRTARVAGDLIDVYPAEVQKKVVALRLSQTKLILGQPSLSRDEIVRVLEALEFTMLDGNDDRMVFEVPFFRLDIEREADLIEEVARMVGYDKIPYQLPVMNIRPTPEDPFIEFQEEARLALALAGFRETISFPFLSADEYAALGIGEGHPLAPGLTLRNPLAEQSRFMRTTLIPGLLKAVQSNRRHGELGVRLFECSRGYFPAGRAMPSAPMWKPITRPSRHIAAKAKSDPGRPTERHWVAGVLDQPYRDKSWDGAETAASFFHAKAAVAGLLKSIGAPTPEFRKVAAEDLPFLHPGAAAVVFAGNKPLGYVGELHPKTALALDLSPEAPPVVFELDLETLFTQKGTGLKLKSDLQKFPPATRDLALLLDTAKTHADVEDAIKAFKKKRFLHRYRLFDVYQGDKLPAGKKSMAYTLYFQSPERTLNDQDVEPETQALVQWLGESLGATQR